MAEQLRKVAVIGGNRIPFARSNGAYIDKSNLDMLSAALEGLINRFNLQGKQVGEVVGGAVLKHSRDFNMIRECILGSKLDPKTPGYDLQQACDTGLQSALVVSNKIRLGLIDSAIAGGVDSTSDAPLEIGPKASSAIIKANAAKTLGDKLKALTKISFANFIQPPQNKEPRTGLSLIHI